MHTAQLASSPTPLRVDKITAMLLGRLARLPFRIYRCRAAKQQSVGQPASRTRTTRNVWPRFVAVEPQSIPCVCLAGLYDDLAFLAMLSFQSDITCVRNTEYATTTYLA